jgi:hypothetical protein
VEHLVDDDSSYLLRCSLRRTHEVPTAEINHATAGTGERQDSALPAAAAVRSVLEDDQPQIFDRSDAQFGEFAAETLSTLVRSIQKQSLAVREGQPVRRLLNQSTCSVANVRVLDVKPPRV